MMNTYLDQQRLLTTESDAGALVVVGNSENITLEDFKNYVRKWLEMDNFIKKAQEVVKEKKKNRDELSQVITGFMCKYNIEDLNTKEGRIRCKVGFVKAPINQKMVKQRLTDIFDGEEERKNEIINKIYNERETAEKVTLRRLKIS
jgi:hypothetical protein